MKRRILPLVLCMAFFASALCMGAQAIGMSEFQKQQTYSGQFTDITGKWHEKYIADLYEYGLTQGTSGGQMSPETPVTLAEVITLAARINAVYYGREIGQPGEPWYSPYVDYAFEHGIISAGDKENAGRTATRGESVRIFEACLPSEQFEAVNGKITFADVAKEDEYFNAVSTLAGAGVVSGYDDGLFRPDAGISRAEALTMADRVVNKTMRPGYISAGNGSAGQRGGTELGEKVTFRCEGVAVFTMDKSGGRFIISAAMGESFASFAGLCELREDLGLVCPLGDRVIPEGAVGATGENIASLVFSYDGGRQMMLMGAVTNDGRVVNTDETPVIGALRIGAVLTAVN